MTLAAGLLLQLAHGAGDIAATVWAGLPAIVWITILSRRSWSGSRSSAFTRSAPTF
jgi:hypothetical protein